MSSSNCIKEKCNQDILIPVAIGAAAVTVITLLVVGILGMKGTIPMPLLAAKLMVRISAGLIFGTITLIAQQILCPK